MLFARLATESRQRQRDNTSTKQIWHFETEGEKLGAKQLQKAKEPPKSDAASTVKTSQQDGKKKKVKPPTGGIPLEWMHPFWKELHSKGAGKFVQRRREMIAKLISPFDPTQKSRCGEKREDAYWDGLIADSDLGRFMVALPDEEMTKLLAEKDTVGLATAKEKANMEDRYQEFGACLHEFTHNTKPDESLQSKAFDYLMVMFEPQSKAHPLDPKHLRQAKKTLTGFGGKYYWWQWVQIEDWTVELHSGWHDPQPLWDLLSLPSPPSGKDLLDTMRSLQKTSSKQIHGDLVASTEQPDDAEMPNLSFEQLIQGLDAAVQKRLAALPQSKPPFASLTSLAPSEENSDPFVSRFIHGMNQAVERRYNQIP